MSPATSVIQLLDFYAGRSRNASMGAFDSSYNQDTLRCHLATLTRVGEDDVVAVFLANVLIVKLEYVARKPHVPKPGS